MEKEVRSIPQSEAEVRLAGEEQKESRNVEGYALVFNKKSKDLGGFRELILPEAMEGVIKDSDILAVLNHNPDKGVLARSTKGKGTLGLDIDSKGVKYSFEAPNYGTGDELVEGLKRGDIRASSFAFTIAEGGDNIEKLADGSILRTITQFNQIHDVSPVYREAYSDTTVALRSVDKFNEIPVVKEETKPVVEETIEPIVEPEEYRMDNDERYLWQRQQQIKMKLKK